MYVFFMFFLFFFFKQKTAYEMRISDWSSDVCSSDLAASFCGPPDRDSRSSSRQPSTRCTSTFTMMWSTRSQVPWGALDLGPGSSRSSAARTRLSSNWRSRFRRPQEPEECRRHCMRSEEHTSELQSLMRNSYAVFCLTKKK